VGKSNFDNWRFRLDFNIAGVPLNRSFAKKLKCATEVRKQNCATLEWPPTWKKMPSTQRTLIRNDAAGNTNQMRQSTGKVKARDAIKAQSELRKEPRKTSILDKKDNCFILSCSSISCVEKT
jgi:hypothetical protein